MSRVSCLPCLIYLLCSVAHAQPAAPPSTAIDSASPASAAPGSAAPASAAPASAAPLFAAAAPQSDTPTKPERIRAAFNAIGGLDAVTVDEVAEVVRLKGTVASLAARRVAEEVARKVADPLYVANAIEVVAPEVTDEGPPKEGLASDDKDEATEGQLRSILGTVDALKNVRSRAKVGIVHLTGKTSDEGALQRMVELARTLEGVLFVDNQVQIETTVVGQVTDTWGTLKKKGTRLLGQLPLVGIGLLIFFLAVALSRAVRRSRVIGRVFSSHALVQTVALRIVSTVIVLAGVMIALDVMDASGVVGALLGTAGIVGLAVGFAFKDIVENYLAGILLAINRPFAAKDAVQIGEWQGKVIRLSARETMLMTYDGNHVQIPNAQVFGNAVLNFSRNPRRRFDFVVGIGNEEDLGRAQRVANEAMRVMEGVMGDPAPYTRLDGFGDSSMTLHFYGWVDQAKYDFSKVKSEVIRTVKRALDENDIDMPNPITQVLLETVERAAPKPKLAESAAPAHDLSVDNDIEEQIDDDPQAQTDLLEGKAQG